MCPICHNPTGPLSTCNKIQDIDMNVIGEEDETTDSPLLELSKKIFNKTLEWQGQIVPIFNDQCIFRRYNNYYIQTNFPISKPLSLIIGHTEGVEQFFIDTKYRGVITIGGQFDDAEVQKRVTETYKDFILDNAAKALRFNK